MLARCAAVRRLARISLVMALLRRRRREVLPLAATILLMLRRAAVVTLLALAVRLMLRWTG